MARKWEYRVEAFEHTDGEGRYDPTPPMAAYVAWLRVFADDGWEVYAVFNGVVHMKRERE